MYKPKIYVQGDFLVIKERKNKDPVYIRISSIETIKSDLADYSDIPKTWFDVYIDNGSRVNHFTIDINSTGVFNIIHKTEKIKEILK